MIGAAFRFCAVGTLVAGLDFASLWLFKQFLPRLVAVSIAYFIGVSAHFCLNKWWVFRSQRELHAAEMARYAITVFSCWLCTISVVWLALRLVTDNLFVARFLAIPLAAMVSFVMMRRFVFPRAHH